VSAQRDYANLVEAMKEVEAWLAAPEKMEFKGFKSGAANPAVAMRPDSRQVMPYLSGVHPTELVAEALQAIANAHVDEIVSLVRERLGHVLAKAKQAAVAEAATFLKEEMTP